MNRAEEIRKANQEKAARIKELYHGSRLCDNRKFTVETKGLSCWFSSHWFFDNKEDAKEYLKNEITEMGRVIELNQIDAHTVETKVVYINRD